MDIAQKKTNNKLYKNQHGLKGFRPHNLLHRFLLSK